MNIRSSTYLDVSTRKDTKSGVAVEAHASQLRLEILLFRGRLDQVIVSDQLAHELLLAVGSVR